MNLHVLLSLFAILIMESLNKGFSEVLFHGSHWGKTLEGICSSTPQEKFEMSLTRCVATCSQNNTCKALFYTTNSRQCRLQEDVILRRSDLHNSPSTVYYKNIEDISLEYIDIDYPGFQTVFFGNNEFLTFRVFFSKVSRQSAILSCNSQGGHLVQIMTPARQEFFESLVEPMTGRGPFWIDVTNKLAGDFNDVNGWTTNDGQPIPMFYWAPGQPKYVGNALCAALVVIDGNKWHAKNCATEKAKYICEL